jgi:hypothetical protein
MNFKPVDEMSLRQLFSTEFGRELLGMSYIGPVLDQNGKIDPSPDCLVLDMRKSPYKVKRCEFKFSPRSKEDFSHNGKFDIGIMWSIQPPLTKEQLQRELHDQNGCYELIVLDEISKFHKLPDYDLTNIKRNFEIQSMRDRILTIKLGLPSVWVIYIGSKIYPKRFDSEKMYELLTKKFPSVSTIQSKGTGNLIGSFVQTTPPLIKRMFGKSYEWNNDFDPLTSSSYISELITVNFRGDLPTDDEIKSVVDSGN